jgi:hypothetical protein
VVDLVTGICALLCAGSLALGQKPQDLQDSATAAAGIANVAILDLSRIQPNPADYQLAADLLGIARSLAPDDEQLLRLTIEAAESAGDQDRVHALSRELFRIDPSDTVALLRIISARVAEHQSADARLGAYDRLLGEDGRKKLDPSIRSRLALDAALLLREQGDIEAFADRLALATSLDQTNKDAAALAVTFFTQRVNDAVGRFELLENLLLADPFDPETHLAMARELAAGGAWEGASRFYATHETLLTTRPHTATTPRHGRGGGAA